MTRDLACISHSPSVILPPNLPSALYLNPGRSARSRGWASVNLGPEAKVASPSLLSAAREASLSGYFEFRREYGLFCDSRVG